MHGHNDFLKACISQPPVDFFIYGMHKTAAHKKVSQKMKILNSLEKKKRPNFNKNHLTVICNCLLHQKL